MNDNAREFINAEAAAVAELLKKDFGDDCDVTVDFDETTGEVTFHPKFHGAMTVIEFTKEIPTDFWEQQ